MAEIYKYAKRYRTQVGTPAGRHPPWGPRCPPSALRTTSCLLRRAPGEARVRVVTSWGVGAVGAAYQRWKSRRRCPHLCAVTQLSLASPQIMTALEANPTARRTQLQHKFEQVVALMEDNIYECYSEA